MLHQTSIKFLPISDACHKKCDVKITVKPEMYTLACLEFLQMFPPNKNKNINKVTSKTSPYYVLAVKNPGFLGLPETTPIWKSKYLVHKSFFYSFTIIFFHSNALSEANGMQIILFV